MVMRKDRKQTIRQEIMVCLKNNRMTVRDISQAVGIMEKDVCHHLEFIERTLRHQGKRIYSDPCYCLSCGFEFNKRKRFKKPGKCPGCKGSRIVPALFWINRIHPA